jgi:hypothetical protein
VRVDERRVAPDDPAGLQLADSLEDGRGGQPDDPGYIGL